MHPLKIAVFHNTAQVGSAWCCAEGMITTLARLGHQTFNCGHPQHSIVPLATLEQMDLIVLGAPEWYDHFLASRYGAQWCALRAPKIAWYAESAYRDDRAFDFARCRRLADLHYFPALQDAEEFGGAWLPFGADTSLFYPMPVAKAHEAAFLGSLYPKRRAYISTIQHPITLLPPVRATHPVESFHLLAQAYNSTHIFVNMPAYSRLLVTKVTEVMACGTMLVTPAIDHPSGLGNMSQFENGKHLVYYDQNDTKQLSAILEHYRHAPKEREAIACAGRDEVLRAHTLEHRVQRMLSDAATLLDKRRRAAAVPSPCFDIESTIAPQNLPCPAGEPESQ